MARTYRYQGVENHYGNLRISFQLQGIRCRESLGIPPTKANLIHAVRLRQEIADKIQAGIFVYQSYFPDSPNLERFGITPTWAVTFGEQAENWLAGQDHLATSTRMEYRKILRTHWLPELGDVPIRDITHSQLQFLLSSKEFGTPKTRNNVLSPMGMVLKNAHLDGLIPGNPAARLRYAKAQAPAPDPLTLGEVNKILRCMDGEIRNYFEFALFTGARTSELIALRWEDIDFQSKLARIQRAKVRGELKSTKTAHIRDVELNSRAELALNRQEPITFSTQEWVFHNPTTGKPYADDRAPRIQWAKTLKLAGIRHRTAYQTRHTFATLNLMAGAKPMWVSRQMGHANMRMLLERYSRWIDLEDKSRERVKIEEIL